MPNRDRTGPSGQGPLTGRGFGPCGKGFSGRFGRGLGRGLGRGFGFGRERFLGEPISLTETEEKKILEAELKEIEAEKKELEKRLKELKA